MEGKYIGSLKVAVNSVRKAKSLVGKWLEKPSGAASPSSPSTVDNLIERDTIISGNVIVGRGESSVTVANTSALWISTKNITTSGSCLKYLVRNGRRNTNSS